MAEEPERRNAGLAGCVGGVGVGDNPWKIVVFNSALGVGNPGHQIAWMSRQGHKLELASHDGVMICPESAFRYKEVQPGVFHCLDFEEGSASPAELGKGTKSY